MPATLSNGHGEFILHLELLLLEVGQLLAQLVVLGELGFPKNRLAVQPREQRHGRDIVIHQQTGIDVLPGGGLLAMNGERVAAGLHHVDRSLGDIHVKVAIGVALERLDELAVKVDLRILIMVNAQDELAGNFNKPKILAQPNIPRVPLSAHVTAGCAFAAEAGPILFPRAIVVGDFKPVVAGLLECVLPNLPLAARGVRQGKRVV